jgi:hypothetical protein
MKRRTYRRIRAEHKPEHQHNVYVVLLDPAVGKLRTVRAANPKRDPKKPCVYVGMTGLNPKERFANHKAGIKAASVVKRYGLRLMPESHEGYCAYARQRHIHSQADKYPSILKCQFTDWFRSRKSSKRFQQCAAAPSGSHRWMLARSIRN